MFSINFYFTIDLFTIFSFNFQYWIECFRMCHLVSHKENERILMCIFYDNQRWKDFFFSCYYCHVVNIKLLQLLLFSFILFHHLLHHPIIIVTACKCPFTSSYSFPLFFFVLTQLVSTSIRKKKKKNKRMCCTWNRPKIAFEYIIMRLFSMQKRFSSSSSSYVFS